ncbi:MAG: hypothetical protein ABWZ40_05290 [Caulobacterales bacterium]
MRKPVVERNVSRRGHNMSEAELLSLAQNAIEQVASLFAQVITINFALAAAVFYFLNEARLQMKIFAAIIYGVGMLMYVGFIGVQTRMWDSATMALQAMPPASLSAPAAALLKLTNDPLLLATTLFLHIGLLILTIGSLFLVFFWKKDAHLTPPRPRAAFRLPNLHLRMRKDRV